MIQYKIRNKILREMSYGENDSRCNGRALSDSGSENKKALGKLQGAGQIEVLVDNETAMKNVMKMAKSSGASAESEKDQRPGIQSDDYGRREERGCIRKRSKRTDRRKRKPGAGRRRGKEAGESDHNPAAENGSNSSAQGMNKVQLSSAGCATCIGTVVAVSSDKMGSGNDELGAVLMKSFFLRRRSLIRFRIKSFFTTEARNLRWKVRTA